MIDMVQDLFRQVESMAAEGTLTPADKHFMESSEKDRRGHQQQLLHLLALPFAEQMAMLATERERKRARRQSKVGASLSLGT